MHFLCLHGMGTNAQVLENNFGLASPFALPIVQLFLRPFHFFISALLVSDSVNNFPTATVRYEMDHIHTFDFPEGCVICPIAPEIKVYYPSADEYYKYYDQHSAKSLIVALSQLEKYIEEEGPFDGVLGFSQGASLAATYLARLSRDQPSTPLPFKCAIFFSGAVPFDPQYLHDEEMRFIDPKATGPLLKLPTANIWGRNDDVWPGSGEVLGELCDDTYKNTYVHDEGHSIPGPRAKEAVQGCMRAIRRVIEQGETLQ